MTIVLPYFYVNSNRFTATKGSGTGTGATFSIAATTFTDDEGTAATAFPATYSYYNLYINGVLQTADNSTVTTSTITIPNGDTILGPLVPVVVEFISTK